jgi:hypothetical protein
MCIPLVDLPSTHTGIRAVNNQTKFALEFAKSYKFNRAGNLKYGHDNYDESIETLHIRKLKSQL